MHSPLQFPAGVWHERDDLKARELARQCGLVIPDPATFAAQRAAEGHLKHESITIILDKHPTHWVVVALELRDPGQERFSVHAYPRTGYTRQYLEDSLHRLLFPN